MKRRTRRADYAAQLEQALQRPYAEPAEDDPQARAILEWLTRLGLLHGVPLPYVLADPRMLPANAIRFFHLDPNWIATLIDGAFSLGRVTTGDAPREQRALVAFAENAKGHARRLRPRILAKKFGTTPPPAEPLDAPKTMSGFVLRSSAIAAWPGIEIRPYDASGTLLEILRFERLGSELLFCICAGTLRSVTLSEPAESLHFGIVLDEDRKRLKYVDAASGHAPGAQMDTFVDIPFRDASRRVIDAAALQQRLHDALIANGGIDPNGDWTPAQFALEMVQGVQEVDFTVEEPL